MNPAFPSTLADIAAGKFSLDAARTRVNRVLNWGGFQTSSFHVTDGSRALHIKLAESSGQAELRRWLAVHEILETRYRAPRVLDWLDVPGTPYGGLVFDHIDGVT